MEVDSPIEYCVIMASYSGIPWDIETGIRPELFTYFKDIVSMDSKLIVNKHFLGKISLKDKTVDHLHYIINKSMIDIIKMWKECSFGLSLFEFTRKLGY